MGSPDLELRDDGTVVVEAPTVEAALVAVQHHCGPNATIVEAEKVQTKGIAGFFTKQLYRVHVAPMNSLPSGASPAAGEADEHAATRGSADADRVAFDVTGAAVDFVLRQVEAGEHGGERTFGETLHAELASRGAAEPVIDLRDTDDPVRFSGSAPLAAPAPGAVPTNRVPPDPVPADPVSANPVSANPVPLKPTPLHGGPQNPVSLYQPPVGRAVSADAIRGHGLAVPAPTMPVIHHGRAPLGRPVDEWVPGAGPVRWSIDHLSRMGLPYRLICHLGDLVPEDDLAWVFRLAESASALCGPMPDEAMVIVGRDLGDTAGRMGIDVVAHPNPPAYAGDVAVSVDSFGECRSYLDRVSAGRPIHVVCDASGFGAELLDGSGTSGVAVVSTTRGALAIALQAVVASGGVLGYVIDGENLVRITPFELALAIRGQMPRE